VTGIASQTAGVIGGDDLGKSLGLGAVGLVAAGADDGGVELRRFYRPGIVGMFGLRSVAGLAGYHHMPSLLLEICDIGMAALAHIVASEGYGPGRDLSNGRAAIVSILSKAAWDDDGPEGNKSDQSDGHDSHQPNEVFDILKQVVRRTPGASYALNCAMLLDNWESPAER